MSDARDATTSVSGAVANVALIAAACIPVALLAGITAMAVVVAAVAIATLMSSRDVNASARAALVSDALSGASLALGGAALCALGAQLLCAVARSEGTRNCARLCTAAYASRSSACSAETSHWVNVSEINDAVIWSVYHPERYKSLQHPHGLVFLESLTMNGARYFQDTSALEMLIRQVAPAHAGAFARSFFAANARAVPVRRTQRNFAEQVMLDSLQAERFLAATTLAEVPLAVTSTLPKLSPNDTVPGVIALSSPGVDASSSMAIVLSVLR